MLVLAVLVGGFLALKLEYNPDPVGHFRLDSTFYYELARSVSEGEGLRTDVSLYHQGLRDFPARTTIYPLWPLFAGTIGRVIGMEYASTLLPETLFFFALLLLYVLANRLAWETGAPPIVSVRGMPIVDLGHVAVMIAGLHRPFFIATSKFNTEGLAYSLLFAALLTLTGVRRRPILYGTWSGALGCLGFLARAQFVLLPVAIVATLAIIGVSNPRFRKAALSAAGAAIALFLPWVLYVATLPGKFNLLSLFVFSAYQETPAIGTADDFVVFASLFDRIAYILGGVRIAFDATSPTSYFRAFGASTYIVPIALLVAFPSFVGRMRRRERVPGDAVLTLGIVLASCACLIPLHLTTVTYPKEWLFHFRHGLALVLAMTVGLNALARRGPILRIVGLLLALSIFVNWNPDRRYPWRMTHEYMLVDSKDPRITPVERELVSWIDAHAEPPVSAAIACRELAVWSTGRFHWLREDLPPETPRRLFEFLDLDYLIVYGTELRFDVYRDVSNDFESVKRFRRGSATIEVFRPRRE